MNPSPTKLVNLWDAAIRIITEPGEESTTKAEHENLLRRQYNQLLNNLTSVSEIAGYMFQDEKLTGKELEHIEQFHSTPIRASEELLNIIMKSSPYVYECFLQSLKETKQHHVYQMLTTSVEQNDYSGHESVSQHSRLIQRNYAWLTEKLNPDHSLLAVLWGKEVLSVRDYEQIISRKETFKKNEMLLSLISRKSSVDFKHFQEALNETHQSHVNQKLTEAAADAECEHKLTAVDKTKTDSCSSTFGKRIPPKIPPNTVKQLQLPVTLTQPKPLLVRGAQPTVPMRFKNFAENHHTSTQHNVNMRQLFNVETQFKRLQNEVQFEVSTKIVVLCKKRTNDNIWKICVEIILHESCKNRESRSRYKSIEEECDRLRQLLQKKSKFFTLQDEIQLEKTKTEKQIRVLQEDKYDVEASLKSAENDNEKLNKRLEESQIVLDNLKALNQETERKAAERDRFQSMQLNELEEKLRVRDTEICELYQIEKELNNEVRKYKEMEKKHHQENYDIKERNEALSTDLAFKKRCLKVLEGETIFFKQRLKKTESQLKITKKKLEETEPNLKLNLKETEENLKATGTTLKEAEAKQTDQATYYEQKLNETESRLRETEKKVKETETGFKLSLRETEEKLIATETTLKKAEARQTDQTTYYEQKLHETESRLRESEKKLEDKETSFKLSLRETEEKLKVTETKLKKAEARQTDQTTYYGQNLTESESRLSETEKKLEETETNFKLSLSETREKLKATKTKLKEAEARLTAAQVPFGETEVFVTAEERKSWREEVQSLTNQIQEQRRLIVELQDKLKSYPLLAHETKRIAAINTKKWILGLALLDKELFVVSEWSSEIEVYNSMKFSHKWNPKELIHPLDIGSCNRNKCLYILHTVVAYQMTEILRVAPNGKLINKWSTGKIPGGNLSVTDDSNVILTALEKNKLNEYSPDGKLIREINLSSDAGIIHPLHAIKLSNSHYLVSHGGNGNERNLVCVVDGDGKLKKSAGTGRGSIIGQTSYPVYLAVDRNGFVMVADQRNSRVLLLDSNLKFKGEILSKEKQGLRGPLRILLDESNCQLFVADNQWDEGRILVFEFG